MANAIELKYGRVRNFWLDNEFTAKNEDIVNAVLDYTNFMAVNGWNMSGLKLVEFTAEMQTGITETLCKLIDVLFDLGVEIYNGWECKTHTSKECYRNYLHGYNNDTPTTHTATCDADCECDNCCLPF